MLAIKVLHSETIWCRYIARCKAPAKTKYLLLLYSSAAARANGEMQGFGKRKWKEKSGCVTMGAVREREK